MTEPDQPPHIHIIGAGMAGLSAALHLAQATRNITLYEAAGHAGGRCRSYDDRELGCRIDNGNHLILSGNVILRDYLMLSGAEDTLTGPDEPLFPFMDLRHGLRWVMQLNRGIMPWWLLNKQRRVPETHLSDYVSVLRVMRATPHETVAELTKHTGMLYERFWEPLCISVLNTPAELGSARLLGNVLSQSFALGGAACRPLFPKVGMSETFVDPCLAVLHKLGIAPHYGARVQQLGFEQGRVTSLNFGTVSVKLAPQDWVILAVPAWVAHSLIPDLVAPTQFCSILNAHFRFAAPSQPPHFAGLVGGVAEWIFARPEVVSITVSAAERYVEWSQEQLITAIWQDVSRYYQLDEAIAMPPYRLVKEKRATFAATPHQAALRPKARTAWQNLVLAGDWTENELPSTIEGAVRTGLRAAQLVTRWLQL